MADATPNAVEVRDLVKRYKDFLAVDHLNLDIRRGELLSLLGPNGAGKSTTLKILTTLLPATSGTVHINGFSVPRDNDRIKPHLGLVPQEIALYDMLTARHNLRFFARLYGWSGEALEKRVTQLLTEVELLDRADDRVDMYSGGMQRRINIAAALIHDPDIIFLDEPTVGLDPISRNAIWKIINDLKARGKTLVLTTHYMEEAEALSDRVAIVDHGKVIAVDSPRDLIEKTGIKTVVNLVCEGDAGRGVEPLRGLPTVKEVTADENRIRLFAESGNRLLPQLIQCLFNVGLEVRSVEVTVPNLGVVFLHYTGRELRD